MPPAIITQPFAWNGEFTPPPTTGSDSDTTVSQEVGFPETQSTPLGSGGVPVNRSQTNGIFNLYSNILVYINTGGTFTFDNSVVTDLGGYNEGAILWCASANQYLISLVNNNVANFITTPSYVNDGINWSFLTSFAYPDITDTAGLVTITGTNGLQVNHNCLVNGAFSTLGVAHFQNSTTGAQLIIQRESSTEPGFYFNVEPENPNVGTVGGSGYPALLYTGGGSGSVQLAMSYNSPDGRAYLPLAGFGAASLNGYAIAVAGDIQVGVPSTSVTISSNIIRATGAVLPSATGGLNISGTTQFVVNIPAGANSNTVRISLVAAGIITGARGYNSYGSVSFSSVAPGYTLQGVATFDGTYININTYNTSGSLYNAIINFSIVI